MFEFRITQKDKKTSARNGVFTTPHGKIHTPVFMPVGTYGAIKTLTPKEVSACGSEIILANTFHLHLRPNEDLIAKQGGLHRFMNWEKPILTDSGGFQVFSLTKMRKISAKGVEFASPVDGRKVFFTPQKVVEIQRKLGSDIIMQLDECASHDASWKVARNALDNTKRWIEESLKAHKNTKFQALFPIIQGVNFQDLRIESAKFCANLNTKGIAIGGLAVGETKKDFLQTLEITLPLLPTQKPRYLMGVGEFSDILESVERGVDMFDCVIPTRLARHGSFFGENFKRENIRNSRFRNDKKALKKGCKCEACMNFSRSYLRHLTSINEVLGMRLLTLHNLTQIFEFMHAIRNSIQKGNFSAFKKGFLKKYKS